MKYLSTQKFCAYALLSLILIGCGDQAVTDQPVTDASIETEVPVTKQVFTDNLPEADFNGETFRVLSGKVGQTTSLAFFESESGETMQDAYYKRNRIVEERFNIDFEENDQGDILSTKALRQNVMANSHEYDMYLLFDRIAFAAAQENLIADFDLLQYIDLNQPYWSQQINDQITVNGKRFFAVGDENPVLLTGATVLFYSKDIASELQLDDPYELVRNGIWTMERYYEMARTAIRDNGDAVWDINDRYGVVTNSGQYFTEFFMVSGVNAIAKDENDLPYFNALSDTRFADIYDAVYRMTYDVKGTIFNVSTEDTSMYSFPDGYDNYQKALALVGDGHALFCGVAVSRAGVLRAYDLNYGVLPFPTYEEKPVGEAYSSRIGALVPYVIPSDSTQEQLDRASILLEALACTGKNHVVDQYYNIVLSQKEANGDPDSIEMLDMIFNNRRVDLGDIYWQVCNQTIYDMLGQKTENYSSKLTSLEKSLEKQIQKTLDIFS